MVIVHTQYNGNGNFILIDIITPGESRETQLVVCHNS